MLAPGYLQLSILIVTFYGALYQMPFGNLNPQYQYTQSTINLLMIKYQIKATIGLYMIYDYVHENRAVPHIGQVLVCGLRRLSINILLITRSSH